MLVLWPAWSLHLCLSCTTNGWGFPSSSGDTGELTLFFSPNSRSQVPASLCNNSLTIPLLALIDSGAKDNFLDRDLAIQPGFSLGSLESPVNTNALDGRLLARVSEQTISFIVVISGNHSERIRLKIISAPETPLVLGHPWLKLHNPQINWSIGKMLGWSPHCHSACLRSALSSVEGPTVPPKHDPPDLTTVPVEYHNLAEVLSKHRALSLPPYRPYDCAIALLSGAPLPLGRLYNLSRPEREAMERYTPFH